MKKTQRQLALNDKLVAGLNEDKANNVRESFTASRSFLTSLADELEKKIENKIKESESSSNYEKNSWSQYQADNFGYRRALRDVLNLFVDNTQEYK